MFHFHSHTQATESDQAQDERRYRQLELYQRCQTTPFTGDDGKAPDIPQLNEPHVHPPEQAPDNVRCLLLLFGVGKMML